MSTHLNPYKFKEINHQIKCAPPNKQQFHCGTLFTMLQMCSYWHGIFRMLNDFSRWANAMQLSKACISLFFDCPSYDSFEYWCQEGRKKRCACGLDWVKIPQSSHGAYITNGKFRRYILITEYFRCCCCCCWSNTDRQQQIFWTNKFKSVLVESKLKQIMKLIVNSEKKPLFLPFEMSMHCDSIQLQQQKCWYNF